MRVALVYPPDFTPPTMPFAALALLGACLKRAGHEALVMDLNAEAFTAMIAEDNLERYFELLDRYTEALAAKAASSPAWNAAYETHRGLHLFPRAVMKEVRLAAQDLRRHESYFDPIRFRHAHRVIRTTHAFLHALTPDLDPRNNNYTTQLYSHLEDGTPDPYVEFYTHHTIPKLKSFDPGLIAMSCPFSRQVAPAMRFAKMVREALPDVRFLIGGTGISDAQDVILTERRFYDYVDYAIVGDGEEALPDLVAAMEGRKAFSEVSALWRREQAEIVRPSHFRNVDMDQNPTPDYRTIDFSHYMLPEPAGFYTTSRGCYYGKCTFCAESFRVGFRMRSPENVYADIRDIVRNQGVRNIHFFDPLTPPRTLAYLSREVAREKLPLNYYAEVKFEKIYTSKQYVKILAEGGCKLLQFGFESGVQRVLEAMKKGNKLDQIEIMLDNLKDHGITVAASWFIGFPTENEDDARETWRFLRRHWDEMHFSLYTGTFGLGHDIPVFRHPEEYDIKLTFDAQGNPSYTRNDGGDWDHQKLHAPYHVRSDIAIAICGTTLLYAAYRPDLVYQLRGMNAIGPVSWEDPPIADRFAAVPAENGCLELAPGPDGKRRFRLFVAQSGDTFDADETDAELLQKIGREGRTLGELIEAEQATPDIVERLGAFIDRGLVESTDPVPSALAPLLTR